MVNREQLYYDTLKVIARHYKPARRIIREARTDGRDPMQYLAEAYEAIQDEAEQCTKGKHRPKT